MNSLTHTNLLVVVDMQNDFINGALGTKEAQSIVPNVIDRIKELKEQGYTVWFTQDSHYSDYMKTEEGKNLPVPHCIVETNGWELFPDIKEQAKDCDKFMKSTFPCYEMAEQIKMDYRKNGIVYDTVELIGVCTGICVISNAIMVKSASPNSHIRVKADCCACVTPESHDRALESMKTLQIEII